MEICRAFITRVLAGGQETDRVPVPLVINPEDLLCDEATAVNHPCLVVILPKTDLSR